jgi:hypothetical protein
MKKGAIPRPFFVSLGRYRFDEWAVTRKAFGSSSPRKGDPGLQRLDPGSAAGMTVAGSVTCISATTH